MFNVERLSGLILAPAEAIDIDQRSAVTLALLQLFANHVQVSFGDGGPKYILSRSILSKAGLSDGPAGTEFDMDQATKIVHKSLIDPSAN